MKPSKAVLFIRGGIALAGILLFLFLLFKLKLWYIFLMLAGAAAAENTLYLLHAYGFKVWKKAP